VKQMTQKYRIASRHGSSTAQIIAAKNAERESIAEARLTMLSALRIGAQRRKLLTVTGNRTYNSSVNPVMLKKAVEKLLRERRLRELSSETPPLGKKKPTGQSSTH
jgi:hypothetical protein